MSKSQHTQGPWYYDGEDTYASESYGGRGFEIFTRDKNGIIWDSVCGEVINEEDARLIAAAPDLLEACKYTLGQIRQIIDNPKYEKDAALWSCVCLVNNAIKKAEGK